MLAKSICVHWFCRSVLAVLMGIAAVGPARAARPQGQDGIIRAHIRAGEFAPALTLARRTSDPKQRDAWLGMIALAQAEAQARDAYLQSAAEIGDDRIRAGVLAGAGVPPPGGRGGAAQPDFDELINLITSTVRPTTWDVVGGPGAISPFPTGVWVDPRGVLYPMARQDATGNLAALRAASRPRAGREENARRNSPLRMISLPRLEKYVQLRLAAGQQPTETMQLLAGLYRIRYVFIYPESGDVVLAGPAGDWTAGLEGAILNAETGRPVVRLDDLAVVFRRMICGGPDAKFGCLITPRPEGLARLQAFLQQSNQRPIHAESRGNWLKQLRAQVGKQDIEVYGLDPRTRAARVMVEADYRMKLIGMGLEKGVPGVVDYLHLIKLAPGEPPPPMTVLRWWFTLDYDAVLASRDRLAFAFRGQGVKVESENERLSAGGKRVHTGESDSLNRRFARSFTEHFEELSQKYPIYGELRNLCDLALAGALIREENAAENAGWHLTCFGDPQAFPVELAQAPKEVDTVMNYRIINRVHILAGVSGGVSIWPATLVSRRTMGVENDSEIENQRSAAAANGRNLANGGWWWD